LSDRSTGFWRIREYDQNQSALFHIHSTENCDVDHSIPAWLKIHKSQHQIHRIFVILPVPNPVTVDTQKFRIESDTKPNQKWLFPWFSP
jgi:hypothetical protein